MPKQLREKLDSRTSIGILVGYTDTLRMVKIYNPEKKTVNIRRDVIIDESKRYKVTLDGNLQDIIWNDPDLDEKQVDPNPDEDDEYFYPTYGNDNPLADLEGENSDKKPDSHEHPPSGEPLEQDRLQERP